MDANVLERVCDPAKYSLEQAMRLTKDLAALDAATPRELAYLAEKRRDSWPNATTQRAAALLAKLGALV